MTDRPAPDRPPSGEVLARSFEQALRQDSGVHRLWRGPSHELRAAAQQGELTFARLRLLIVASFSFLPALHLLDGEMPVEGWLGALVITGALALGWILLRLARERELYPWVSFASTLTDVTLLTITLGLYSWLSDPLIATNSQFTWGIYLMIITASALRYDPRVCLWAGGMAIAQYIALALLCRSRLLQGVPLDSPEYGVFSWQTQAARLILMAATTILAWVLVRRAEQLWRLSVRDARTGLYIHGFLVDRLDALLARAQRSGEPVSVAMIDVDRFKETNDRFGHAAGDEVLSAIATALSRSVRPQDLAGRYGGDEFALLMGGLDAGPAIERMEQLRRSLEGVSFTVAGRAAPPLSVSIGVATGPAEGATAKALLARADERLYAAKQQGRGQVRGTSSG
ncbi:MAG: GGDEF domain-containing protein [Thermoanaerobaculia bacterium]